MLKDIIWNFFLKTGDIDTYLCYKKIEEKTNKMTYPKDLGKEVITR